MCIVIDAKNTELEKKLKDLCELNPKSILKVTDISLRECGLSNMKVQYFKDISLKVVNGELNLAVVEVVSNTVLPPVLISIGLALKFM